MRRNASHWVSSFCAVATAIACALFAAPAWAAADAKPAAGDFPISLRGSIGFTLDPDTFLVSFELPIEIRDGWSVGPLLQLGFTDDWLMVAPTLNAAYAFQPFERGKLHELRLIAQGGLGFAFLRNDDLPGDDDDAGFLIDMGFGIEHPIGKHASLGSSVLFNVLPGTTLGQNLIVSWQFATLRVRF